MVLVTTELDDTILKTIPAKGRMGMYENLIGILSTVPVREKILPRAAAAIVAGTLALSAGTCLIVIGPFLVMPDLRQALLVSNLAGIVLFSSSVSSARGTGTFPRRCCPGSVHRLSASSLWE